MAGLRHVSWLTWANVLTSFRLFATVPLYYSIMNGAWSIACFLFWLAVASDLIDGRIARARGETSAFGGLLDHATDAIFVVGGLVALANFGATPRILPWLVGTAFLQYVFDSKALAGRSLRASEVGRWNGILYFVPIGVVVTRDSVGLTFPTNALVLGMGWALVVSTLISMSDRLRGLIGSGS